MEARITVIKGKAKRKEVTLPLPIIVGRSNESGLSIPHAVVSRQHCEIFESGGEVRLRDLGSTNGTTVNGKRIAEVVLRPHDHFEIGPYSFQVDYEPTSQPVAEQPAEPAAAEQDPELDADQCYRLAEPVAEPVDDPAAARRTLAEVRRRASQAAKAAKAAATSTPAAAIGDADLEDLDDLLEGLKHLNLKEFLKGLE